MNVPEWDDLPGWPFVLAGLFYYVVVATLSWRLMGQLLPRPRVRRAPWSAFEIVAVVYLVLLVIPSVCSALIVSTGLGDVLYGAEMMKAVRSSEAEVSKLPRLRVQLAVRLLELPLQVLSVVRLLGRFSDTRPYQLGLTTHRAGANILLGFLGWVILTPLVLALYQLVAQLFLWLNEAGVKEHPFEQLSKNGGLVPGELVLVVLLAVVAAPLVEELLFRGLLLRWLARREIGSHIVMAVCVVWTAALAIGERDVITGPAKPGERVQALAPLLFVLLLLPGYYWLSRWEERETPAALYSSSLLFAIIHSFAWPSPVPLFVLALGLGWLSWRTQSLLGPIVLHSLFNGVACVQPLAQ